MTNNNHDSISPDAIKLASKSLELWDEVNKNGMGKLIPRLGISIESENVIRKSNDPVTGAAKNIVKKMLTTTVRIMRRGR